MAHTLSTTKLAKAATIVANELFTPSFTSTPLFDLAFRLGRVFPVDAGVVNIPVLGVKESLQTVAAYGQWTTATSNSLVAYQVQLWDSCTYPVKIDERHIGINDESKLENLQQAMQYGVSGLLDRVQYAFFNSAYNAYDGSAYNKPFAGINNALPMGATGTYYGIDRGVATNALHFYANASAHGGGASANSTKFSTDATGFLPLLREARVQAQSRGASHMVCFVDPTTAGFFGRYADANRLTSVSQTPTWVPNEIKNNNLSVGAIGYSIYLWDDVLIVPVSGIDTTYTNGYLVPMKVNGQPNLLIPYTKPNSGITGKKLYPFVSFSPWNCTDRSWTWESAAWANFSIVIGDLSVCATIKHDGTYSA